MFWADSQGVDSMAIRMSQSMAAVHSRQGKLLGGGVFTGSKGLLIQNSTWPAAPSTQLANEGAGVSTALSDQQLAISI